MLKVLLVGKTGCGKSATGNSILKKDAFISRLSPESVTKTVDRGFEEINGKQFQVIDCPGLLDTESTPEEAVKLVLDGIKQVLSVDPEIHVVFYVCSLGRFTKEDSEVINQLKKILGEDFLQKHGIIAVTHADDYDKEEQGGLTMAQYIKQEKGPFGDILKECKERFLCFDNVTDEESQMEEQRQMFYKSVVEVSKNGSLTGEELEKLKEMHKTLCEETGELSKETLAELSIVGNLIKKIDVENAADPLKELKELEERLIKVEKIIEEKNSNGKYNADYERCALGKSLIETKRQMVNNNIKRKKRDAELEASSKEDKEQFLKERRQIEEEKEKLQKCYKDLQLQLERKQNESNQDNILYCLTCAGKLVDMFLSVQSQINNQVTMHVHNRTLNVQRNININYSRRQNSLTFLQGANLNKTPENKMLKK